MINAISRFLKKIVPTPIADVLRLFRRWRDVPAVLQFLSNKDLPISFGQRLSLLRKMYLISFRVPCPHNQQEMLAVSSSILAFPADRPGVFVEAGCYKGGSTSKFSLAADLINRQVVAFDSFQGLPKNEELIAKNKRDGSPVPSEGFFAGSMDEVKGNISKYGKIERCRFIKGWFDDTMPLFHEPVLAVYIDVDLASSTKTCLKNLFPLLQPGGTVYSQDGHLPLVTAVLDDDEFWLTEIGCRKPRMEGLGTSRLIKIVKDG